MPWFSPCLQIILLVLECNSLITYICRIFTYCRLSIGHQLLWGWWWCWKIYISLLLDTNPTLGCLKMTSHNSTIALLVRIHVLHVVFFFQYNIHFYNYKCIHLVVFKTFFVLLIMVLGAASRYNHTSQCSFACIIWAVGIQWQTDVVSTSLWRRTEGITILFRH